MPDGTAGKELEFRGRGLSLHPGSATEKPCYPVNSVLAPIKEEKHCPCLSQMRYFMGKCFGKFNKLFKCKGQEATTLLFGGPLPFYL